ncbi:MAG: hypothetical protein F4Z08_02390 [Chloroflexi bacterium]|nr:hypothetical protein [Chloroflexota bacterium]
MVAGKKRLTLDVDAALRQRLKVVAALRGVSMREYCETAIERELARDEAGRMPKLPFGPEAVERLMALQARPPGGGMFEGDSTDFIREAREGR